MPAYLNIKEYRKVLTDNPGYDIEVMYESGTNSGTTLFHMQPYFKEIYTCEILMNLYLSTMQKSIEKGFKNIFFYCGDTLDILPKICEQINEPMLFWLDGHYFKHGKGRGRVDPPMKEELEIILEKHNQNSIIMIDNISVCGHKSSEINGEDWTDLSIDKIVSKAVTNPKYVKHYEENDRLIILLRKI
jgi:hypothetical protein